jgi:4-amino-4-deoxy-L-arabinose transferase-like glycosyltransferase
VPLIYILNSAQPPQTSAWEQGQYYIEERELTLPNFMPSEEYPIYLTVYQFWLTQLPTISEFPPFLDESVHVYFGEMSRQTSPLAFADEGRLFTTWWYMLFQPHQAATLWIVRAAAVLIALVSTAAAIGVGRLAAGVWGGVTAGLLYLFSAYHLFFERLALADSLSGAAVSVGLYFAYRLSRRVHLIDALLTGVAIFIAIGFKVSALPYLGIPVAAALTLRPKGRSWRNKDVSGYL